MFKYIFGWTLTLLSAIQRDMSGRELLLYMAGFLLGSIIIAVVVMVKAAAVVILLTAAVVAYQKATAHFETNNE